MTRGPRSREIESANLRPSSVKFRPRISALSGFASAARDRIRELPIVWNGSGEAEEAVGSSVRDTGWHPVDPAAAALGDGHWQDELQEIVPLSSVTRHHFRYRQAPQASQAKAVGENQEMHVSAVQLRPRGVSRSLVRAQVGNRAPT